MKSLLRRKLRIPARSPQPPAGDLFHAPGEAPAVHSFSRRFAYAQARRGSDFQAALTQCLEGVLAWAKASRYLVGQVKVFVEAGEDSLWLASTGRPPTSTATPGWAEGWSASYQVSFTAIVFGPAPDALKALVEALLGETLV